MAFLRPTLPELITRVEGDIKSGLGLVVLLRKSFLKVLARALAGLAHLMYGFFSFMEKQYFEDTAEGEYLKRKAGIWGVTQKISTFAEFMADVSGTVGVVIPAGTIFKRTDGAEYTTVAEVILDGTGDQVQLVASLAGKFSQVDVGDVVTILSPIAGLTSAATVATIIIESEDPEDDESLRARLLARIKNPYSGGTANDYIQWALNVPGITRSWVNPQGLGPGTVVVYVVSDDETPITASPAKIQEVDDYIEELRPVTANVTVTTPVLVPLNILIALKPNTVAVQTAVINELKDLILRESNIAGSYQAPGVLNDGKIYLSRLDEAISLAVGEVDHNIVTINGVTPADITPANGQLIVLGAITWQALA